MVDKVASCGIGAGALNLVSHSFLFDIRIHHLVDGGLCVAKMLKNVSEHSEVCGYLDTWLDHLIV